MKRLVERFDSIAVGRKFAGELAPYRGRLVVIGVLSLLIALMGILRPWPIKWIFDGALAPQGETRFSFETIVWTGVAAAVLIALAHAGLQYMAGMSVARVSHQFTRQLRFRIFSHLAHLSPLFHARHKSGDLMVRMMGDVPMVSTMMVDSSVEVAARSALVVGIVGVMVFMDPLLTLTVFVVVPFVVLVVRWISKHIHIAVRKQRRKEGDLADYLHEAISATPTIQSLGGSDHVVRRFARSNRRSARAGLKAKRLAVTLSASVETMLGVALACVLAFGSFRVASGHLTPGDLLVFLSYVRSLLKPLRSATKHAERIAKGTACGERILGLLEEEVHVRSVPGAPPAPAEPRYLSFEDVGFSYDGESRALQGLDARFHKGELAALVGRNGAGKSTAASLALRLFDPDSGSVCLDGKPIASLDLESVRQRIALSMQRTVLLGESIRENLLLGKPDASDEELRRALAAAGALELVNATPEGLDTRLGAGGVGLSGGEQSRLSLARTLLRGASVLIVDEPFAGLDALGVEQVSATLRELARERIVVVIAHNLKNLDVYDRVVFIDAGSRVADGTHAELMERHELYRQLVGGALEVGV